ncbi:MAG TPA: diguanylate cyclase [Phycisphaerae bacterium]|mgnify:CR=1 FL=1|jgi:diguanylate cyclase (GGDEF)-like protein|nr:diguanylate cyclase [Phycisphaerae bacterium]HOB74178.1 diguanylate cyclase [Phycisphaerae bacterium]HOJ55898.1 diguanylate cyclase [Phycisphaerae bacterium]HOL27636.1 diguanylate cyclase [Phycisphaerae bacterium]HPP22162.1 diguanylate cyclase [Phycisphaerae bacterium]
MINLDRGPLHRERLLIVQDPGNLAQFARARYPQFEVSVTSSYLEGIAALAGQPARAVLVGVDPTARKLKEAVAGLRRAAGASTPLILCCRPSGEPVAREAAAQSADDYLIYPPVGEELDQALKIPSAKDLSDNTPAVPAPTWEEITRLAAILSNMNEGVPAMLERVCRLIADSLRTANVRIVIEGAMAHLGDPSAEPTLAETILSRGRTLGRILVGGRSRSPFTRAEVEKLSHYARLLAHLLDAAEQQEHWQRLAFIDETTGLPNRRYLMEKLEEILQRAATEQFRVTLLIFDLDGFKHFNDTYGHAAGDAVIRDTAQLFRKHCRQHDIVARYAGDEFVVVFWDAEGPRVAGSRHPTDVLSVLHRIKKALASQEFPMLGPEAVGKVTISGGLASFPWDARTAQGLLERADQALLQAKRAGKNRIFLVGQEGNPVEHHQT